MYFRLRQILNFYRLLPTYLIVITQKNKRKELIIDEIFHWKKCVSIGHTRLFDVLSVLLLDYTEYRNVLQYRLRYSGGGEDKESHRNISFS